MNRSLLLAFSLTLSSALAQEHVTLPLTVGHLTTLDGKNYENVVITATDDAGVKIQHDGGLARVLYSRLPSELSRKFALEAAEGKTNQEAEDKRLKEEAAETAAREAAHPAPKAPVKDDSPRGYIPNAPSPPSALPPETQAKIAALEASIRKLESSISDSQAKIRRIYDRQNRAVAAASGANDSEEPVKITDKDKGPTPSVGYSGKQRENYENDLVDKENAKIDDAQRLIGEERHKISVLKDTPATKPDKN